MVALAREATLVFSLPVDAPVWVGVSDEALGDRFSRLTLPPSPSFLSARGRTLTCADRGHRGTARRLHHLRRRRDVS